MPLVGLISILNPDGLHGRVSLIVLASLGVLLVGLILGAMGRL